jgi:hypothetical protein
VNTTLRQWRETVKASCLSIGAALSIQPLLALAQIADFQVVWINVGEVAAEPDGRAVRAGRQLFMAPDLVQFSLKKITVAHVDVEPAVVSLNVGDRFCLTSVHAQVSSDDRGEVDNAPLSVSIRQDQRERLALRKSKNDICFTPTTAGEYPVRFNSLLPARDGTTRGAQIFLRVQGDNAQEDGQQDEGVPTRDTTANVPRRG